MLKDFHIRIICIDLRRADNGKQSRLSVPMPVPAVPVAQRRSSYQTAVAVIWPPKTRGKKAAAKADQDEEAKLRAECAKLAEEKNVPWGEIARFFPGESLDTVPGSPGAEIVSFVPELS